MCAVGSHPRGAFPCRNRDGRAGVEARDACRTTVGDLRMKCNYLGAILGGALMLGAYSTANAATILSKPLNLTLFGWNSNFPNNLQQSTDDVQLIAASTVDMIEWYGFGGAGTTSFRIRFFTGVADNAVTVHFYQDDVTATAVDTGFDHVGFDVFKYTADITDVLLMAGTRYELSIMSTLASTWTWNHSDSEGGDDLFHRDGDADDWREIGGPGVDSHAFTLLSAMRVPEPGTLAIFGLGLAGLGFARRRRKAA